MENVRYNISPCKENEVTDFIKKIDTSEFVPNGAVRSSERSHYDRYSFLCDENRVAIVYDTLASIVSITGRVDYATKLLDLFGARDKTVKRSTVPAQGSIPKPRDVKPAVAENSSVGVRAKLFVPPERIKRRNEFAPATTVIASANGAFVSTDEIFPPQTVIKKPSSPAVDAVEVRRAVKRPLPSYGESSLLRTDVPTAESLKKNEAYNSDSVGLAISVGGRAPSSEPRRAVISFGDADDSPLTHIDVPEKRKRGRPPKIKSQLDGSVISTNIVSGSEESAVTAAAPVAEKRRRGRPPKAKSAPAPQQPNVPKTDGVQSTAPSGSEPVSPQPPKNGGYTVKNYSPDMLVAAVRKLRSDGKTVIFDGTEGSGTPQELKTYTVHDANGQKVLMRYAVKRAVLQLQGKNSPLFESVIAVVTSFGNVTASQQVAEAPLNAKPPMPIAPAQGRADTRHSNKYLKLKRRIPTAFEYLSEQSRADFSCGLDDFAQKGLMLSDYSVLLVPAFRGLERFIFDIQRTKDINVKMIGQAFDKDDDGKYVLKSGYCKRIDSVIYAEVLVALYTEYFAQRNFFAHSDNTDNNVSRSIPERAAAQRIYDHILDVVEYNSKKLKEIGFVTA